MKLRCKWLQAAGEAIAGHPEEDLAALAGLGGQTHAAFLEADPSPPHAGAALQLCHFVMYNCALALQKPDRWM